MARNPKDSPEARLIAGLIALKLDPKLAAPLLKYLGELVLWNKAYNLTAVREPAEMVTRHILDSLVLLPFVSGLLLDVGSGAGLPGLPLAIADPKLHVTLLDANGKKARFLRHAQRQLALENVDVTETRAEAFKPSIPYAVIVSRAFGSLKEFLEATQHLGAPDGQWLAMKGKLDPAELAAVPPAFKVMQTARLEVPGLAEERHVVVVHRAA